MQKIKLRLIRIHVHNHCTSHFHDKNGMEESSSRPLLFRTLQGRGDSGTELLFNGGFSAFNMLVRMQPGSIPAAACLRKQYLYLNNVDKLNVIFNV